MSSPYRYALAAALVGLGAVAAGCSQSPQEQYDDSVNSLKDVRQDVSDAKDQVRDARENVQDAQQAYQDAQNQLASARQQLQESTSSVQKNASDQVLFRTLQRDVLKRDEFSDAAISVNVEQRVVTLTGKVADADTKNDAVKLVSQQPGVAHVIDKLQVRQANGN